MLHREASEPGQAESTSTDTAISSRAYGAFVSAGSCLSIRGVATSEGHDDVYETVIADRVLHRAADYRTKIREWFSLTGQDGHLILIVPHAYLHDRDLTLSASPTSATRRLYTLSLLLREIEESLVPNSYRVRLAQDDDSGYDYEQTPDKRAAGSCDAVVVLQKIVAPAWKVETDDIVASSNPYETLFFAPKTRIESAAKGSCRSILALKLDHLGDFVMGIPSLERLRRTFPRARLTLVVGSWNADLARESGLADEVILFDAFPRNSSEETVDLAGKRALFAERFSNSYDLAVDLRSDPDTRFLLTCVNAQLRAGLGTRSSFPWLDIFLPIDFNRHGPETSLLATMARVEFQAAPVCQRSEFRIAYPGRGRPERGALIWGPYRQLSTGSYLFEPLIERESTKPASGLTIDITLNGEVAAKAPLEGAGQSIAFDVHDDQAQFESRIWVNRWKSTPPFSFYGGRLFKVGTGNVLHQSEYLSLLVELIALRTGHTGVLTDAAAAPISS